MSRQLTYLKNTDEFDNYNYDNYNTQFYQPTTLTKVQKNRDFLAKKLKKTKKQFICNKIYENC
jgi:hypothetical protein